MYDCKISLKDGSVVETRLSYPQTAIHDGFIIGGKDGALTIYSPLLVEKIEAAVVPEPSEQ
jgi:hypothetical protein